MNAKHQTLAGSSASSLKSHNLRAILYFLVWHAPISRVRIAQLSGLSTTTATNLIGELLEKGLVEEGGFDHTDGQRSVGRPRVALRLVPHARFAIGVHIGVGSVYVAVTNLFASPVYSLSYEYPIDKPALTVLDDMHTLIEQAIYESGVDRNTLVGVGIGASGLVDLDAGVNILAPNLGWHNVSIRDHLSSRLNLPVFVDNNVRAMALAEAMFGAGTDVSVLAFVYARIGVGAGFVLDGQLYRGGAGAGEIGHLTLLANGGEPCRCGNTGCLETLVSEPTMIRQAQAIIQEIPDGVLAKCLNTDGKITIEHIFDAARAGDSATVAMLDRCAYYMGIGLANLVNTLSPEMIILGGIFAQGKDILFPVVEKTLRERAFANLGDHVQLQTPTFGPDTGMIGAATLALRAFFYEQPEGAF